MLECEIEKIVQILAKARRIALITHKNADPDAFFSAYAFNKIISYINSKAETTFIFPESISSLTRKLLENLSLTIGYIRKYDELRGKYDTIAILDTGSPEQLGEFMSLVEEAEKILLIDHHYTHKYFRERAVLCVDSEAKSTAEIVHLFFEKLGIDIDREVAVGLLAAILYDTRQFSIARPKTLRISANLLEVVGELREILKLFRTSMDISEKIARLKAAMRMNLYRANNFLIAISDVGAYEASAARALLDLGADVAFIVSEDDTVRVSVRAKEDFVKQTGIHFGRDIMAKLGEALGGTGGGHDVAAGAEGRNVSKDYVKGKIIEILSEKLKEKGYKITMLKP